MLGPCLMITSYPRRIPLILSSGGGFQVISSRDPFSWTVTFRGNTDGTEKDQRRRTKRVRSRNNYRAAKRRLPLKSFFFTVWCAPASKHGGNHPAKQSPMVREGRKFRGAPPLKCFFRVSYVTFQGGKKCGDQVDMTFLWRGLAVSDARSFRTFLFLYTATWSGERLAQYKRYEDLKKKKIE